MSNETMSPDDLREALTIVHQVAGRRKGGDLEGAYRLVRGGMKMYPGLSIPDVDDVWGVLSVQLIDALGGVVPVSGAPVSAAPVSAAPVSAAPVSAAPVSAAPVSAAPVSAAPVSAAPVSAAPVSAAPVSAAPVSARPVSADPMRQPGPGLAFHQPSHGTITLKHTVPLGTILYGSEKYDGASDVIGSDGQHWAWHRSAKYFHLSKSAGFTADVERIGWAALALRRAGWDVVVEIDNGNAAAKRSSAYRTNRNSEVRLAALRQDWVDSAALLAAAPVSAVPARRSTATPIVVTPVSAPRPPQPATPIITVPAYPPMGTEELITAALSGDLSALGEVRARLNRLAEIDATAPRTSDSIPDEAWDAALADLTDPSVPTVPAPVSAPPAPVSAPPAVAATVPAQVVINGDTAEVWFTANVSGKAMRETATTLRRGLMHNVTHRFGASGDRPEPQVFRSKAHKAFRVTVKAPSGVDVATLALKAIEVAGRTAGVGSILDHIALATETVNA